MGSRSELSARVFHKRIAGDRADVLFPVPRDQDPAFWKPRDEDIRLISRRI